MIQLRISLPPCCSVRTFTADSPNGLTFYHRDPRIGALQATFRGSRPFGSIHKRFSCTRVDGESSTPAPLSICPSDLVLDGQCYRSTPLRQAGLLHCWRCRNGDLSTTCLLEISRGWPLFEVGYAGDFFLLTRHQKKLRRATDGFPLAHVSAVGFSTRFRGVNITGLEDEVMEFVRSLVSACSCLMESLLFQIIGHGPQQSKAGV